MGSLEQILEKPKVVQILGEANRTLECLPNWGRIESNPPAFDLHVHSDIVPNAPLMKVRRIATNAQSVGLAGIALTEHNRFREPAEHGLAEKIFKQHGIVYIPGVEVTLKTGVHILLIFSSYSMAVYLAVKRILEYLETQDLKLDGVISLITEEIEKAKKQSKSGFEVAIILAHPSKIGVAFRKSVSSNASSFDGVEAQTLRCAEFAKRHNLPMVSGSDAHIPMLVGIGYTPLYAKNSKEVVAQILKEKAFKCGINAKPQYRWWHKFFGDHPELPPDFTKCREVFCRF